MAKVVVTKYFPEDQDPEEELSQEENQEKPRPEKRSDNETTTLLISFIVLDIYIWRYMLLVFNDRNVIYFLIFFSVSVSLFWKTYWAMRNFCQHFIRRWLIKKGIGFCLLKDKKSNCVFKFFDNFLFSCELSLSELLVVIKGTSDLSLYVSDH